MGSFSLSMRYSTSREFRIPYHLQGRPSVHQHINNGSAISSYFWCQMEKQHTAGISSLGENVTVRKPIHGACLVCFCVSAANPASPTSAFCLLPLHFWEQHGHVLSNYVASLSLLSLPFIFSLSSLAFVAMEITFRKTLLRV